MDILEEARRVLRIEIASIQGALERLQSNFVSAVELLYKCKGKIVVSGLGKSGLIGRKIASTLASTGTPAIFLHPSEGMHGDIGMIMREDVAILISNSGETEEVVRLIPSIKRMGIQLLALTGRSSSTLARHADTFIDVGVNMEACPNNLAPTASTTTTLAMGDALAIVLMKKRGLKKEDFAFLHPGGSIGKRLLLKVDDVMHIDDANPLVSSDKNMTDAILEITTKGLGAVSVIDDQGILVGIITDGDLRRMIGKYRQDLLERSVAEVMTRDPITIAVGSLAVQAVRIMEDRPSQIAVIPVIDEKRRPVGLLRLHDLVKAGVI